MTETIDTVKGQLDEAHSAIADLEQRLQNVSDQIVMGELSPGLPEKIAEEAARILYGQPA